MSHFVFFISLLIVAQHVSGNHVEQLLEEKKRIQKVTSSWFFLSTLILKLVCIYSELVHVLANHVAIFSNVKYKDKIH